MIKLSWYGHSTRGLAVGGTAILVDPGFTGAQAASITTEVSLLAHDVAARKSQAGSTPAQRFAPHSRRKRHSLTFNSRYAAG